MAITKFRMAKRKPVEHLETLSEQGGRNHGGSRWPALASFVKLFEFGIPLLLGDVSAIAIAAIFLLDVTFPVFAE